jgi:hypothetical protein
VALSFSEAAAQAVQGAACSLLAASDNATAWINSVYGLDGDFGNIAGALRKNICNESEPDISGYGPQSPFTGGQCSTDYRVIYEWANRTFATDCSSRPDQPLSTEDAEPIFGPITGVRFEFSMDGPNDPRCAAGWSRRQIVIDHAGGSSVVKEDDIDGFSPGFDETNGSVAITAVERLDGLPDDCGNPLGGVGEYNDYSETTAITYEDNSGTEVTENVTVSLRPLIVGIGGILYAPVTVNVGGITLSGTVKLAPEFKVDLFPDGLFGGGGNTDNPAPEPSEPDPTPTPPDDRRRIIGAICTTTNFDPEISQVTQVAQGETPDIFVPRTGNISFYIDTPGGQAWTEPTPLRNVRQYVPCPAREGAVDVAVTEGTGFITAVTPVYADLAI